MNRERVRVKFSKEMKGQFTSGVFAILRKFTLPIS